jgi:hypothetical protein
MKETFEEAADEYFKLSHSRLVNEQQKEYERELFIAGYKLAKERMYSEVIEFAEWIRNNPYIWNYPDKLKDTRTTEEL